MRPASKRYPCESTPISRLAGVLVALVLFSVPGQCQRLITNISIDYAPTLFFETPLDPTPFEQLPFETVELSVLDTTQARNYGFVSFEEIAAIFESRLNPGETADLSETDANKNYLVVVESWQRFEVRYLEGSTAFMKAVEGKTRPDFSTIEPFSDKSNGNKRKTLVKLGVSFRIVFIIEKVVGNNRVEVPLEDYFKGNRRIMAKLEIAGAGSPELTAALPGVFKLLSGSQGLSDFLTEATQARQKIWDGFRGNTLRPSLQVLGWAFLPQQNVSTATPPPQG